jgi:hypothetical protein
MPSLLGGDVTMSAIVDALLAELDDADLAALAAKLRPFLEPSGTTTDGWLRGADQIAA